MYEDAAEFLEQITLPVYFVTNSDDRYIYESMERNGIHPTGVFTSEQAKYSKPRKEIFQYAIDKIGLKPEEVIHIGDSLESDVKCPRTGGNKKHLAEQRGKSSSGWSGRSGKSDGGAEKDQGRRQIYSG